MNVENVEQDVWDMSKWKTDIPTKVQYVKRLLSSAPFPSSCRQVLHLLNQFFESSSPESLKSPALFLSAFISELIDNYLFPNKTPQLSSLQELKLLEVLCKYFDGQKSEFVRWCVFDTLFSFSDQEQKNTSKFSRRIDLLTKLVSMAIALRSAHLLDCMAYWIQKHRQASAIVMRVTLDVIDDYTKIVPRSLSFLENISSISGQFVCQVLVVLTSRFTMIPNKENKDSYPSNGNQLSPSLLPLKVVVKWISGDPSICLIKPNRTLITLPSLHNLLSPKAESAPLPLCPIQGLVRWTILQPLVKCVPKEVRSIYSELHLGVLQALVMSGQSKQNPKDEMELEPGEVMDESDMLRHLLNSDDLKKLTSVMIDMIDTLKTCSDSNEQEESWDINLSIDRLAQVIQIAIATGCLSSSKSELLSICKSMRYNKLLDAVVSNLDSL